jgi:polysaccharide export outer membrane protein
MGGQEGRHSVSRRIILAIMIASLGTSVYAKREIISSGDRYSVSPDVSEGYKLGIGDKVRLTVYNEPALSGDFSVSADGALSLPLIGDISVLNKSTSEAAKLIQTKLGDGYLRDPKVSMEVVTYRPFFILGEVKSPGQYPFSSGLTVMNAIATAEGFTPRAERKSVYIRRLGAVGEEQYRLTPDLRVWPGDTIRLGERYF